MKLHWSPRSPYVRMVMIAAQELGVADKLETVRTPVEAFSYAETLGADNPLGKLPTLVRDDGFALFDSRVICEYLDETYAPGHLFPKLAEARFIALRDLVLGNGLLDTFMIRLVERIKPEQQQSKEIIAANTRKCEVVFDRLEADAAAMAARKFDVGHIGIGVALAYADFRFETDNWRNGRPNLADWYASFIERPAVIATPITDDVDPSLGFADPKASR